MFIDASALVAVLLSEPEANTLLDKMDVCSHRYTSAVAIFETVRAVMGVTSLAPADARAQVERFLAVQRIEVVEIGSREAELALEAMDRFGKGRHPARLNMGDCFAYACARVVGEPLLFKGNDFALTDIAPA